ncbi:MAG: type II secretion system F family protein [Chloroflexi bacterium]|nr:type II secretion system F family protein [Chloroflexota bacterium]
MVWIAITIGVMFLLSVLALFVGIWQVEQGQETAEARLRAYIIESIRPTVTPREQGSSGKTILGRLIARFRRSGGTSAVARSLALANVPLKSHEFYLLRVGCALLGFVLALALTRQWPIAMVAAFLTSFLPEMYVSNRHKKRHRAFQEQLVDVLTLIVGSLRGGYGLTQALSLVAQEMPPPASEEFGRVVRETALGLSTEQALLNLAQRMESDDLDLVVTAINIQRTTGGNLAEILDTIIGTIRERIRLKGQLKALTAQQSLTRYILTGLPVALTMIMYVLNPGYVSGMFQPGWPMLIPIGAAISVVTGFIIMGKIMQIEA